MKTPDEIRSLLDINRYVHFHAGDREAHISPLEVLQFEDAVAVVMSYIQELEERVQYGITAFETIHDEARKFEAMLEEYEKPLVPLTLEETKKLVGVWLEDAGCCWGDDEPHPVLYHACVNGYWSAFMDRDFEKDGEYRYFVEAEYGSTWRCWSRKPTGEERKAAKWNE